MAGKQAKPAPVNDDVVAPKTSAEGVDDDDDHDADHDDDAPAKPLPEAKVVDHQATARDAFRGIKLGGFFVVLFAGWLFVLGSNKFHVTAPVVFVCLGYLAILMTVLNLWRTGAAAVSPDEGEAWGRPLGARGALDKEKKTLLKAIKEAEFDLAMGKLSKADCDSLIREYRARAIEVIKELDRSAGRVLTPKQEIEREIKARIALDLLDKPSKRARNVVEAKEKANAARIARNTPKPVADEKADESDAAPTSAHDEDSKPAATGDHA
ncbi:MAG: hypothetical protein ABI678_17775 [Kofleriaceae bacterium]